MNILYAHCQQGRRPLTLAAGLLTACIAVLGLRIGAPWFWWRPVGAAVIGIAWILIANQQSGAILTGAVFVEAAG